MLPVVEAQQIHLNSKLLIAKIFDGPGKVGDSFECSPPNTYHLPISGMAGQIDYNALRAQTMGSGADEEAVTVNTRALIDKVLARYSGEW